MSLHCYQNQFCFLSLEKRSARPQTQEGLFQIYPHRGVSKAVYVQLLSINCPSAQAKQVPFKVGVRRHSVYLQTAWIGKQLKETESGCQTSYPLASSTH